MKMQKLWYLVALAATAMLPLVGCSGGNGSSITTDTAGKITASIAGVVEIDKSVAKSVGATAGALGKVEAFNAYSSVGSANKAALGSAEVMADGSFTGLNFTLPATQSAVIFKATLTGPPESKLYNITPMDLASPPSGLVNNNVQIAINNASTATANAVMIANGATLLDKGISPTKAFSAVAASVVANGGSVLSYASNGIKLAGAVGDSSAKVAETCSVCHGTGKTANVDTAHGLAGYQDLNISNIVATPSGADLVVTFNAKVNGVNKTNYDGFYKRNATSAPTTYRLDGPTMNRISIAAGDAILSGGTSGNYTITLLNAAANPNSRYLLAIWNAAEYALPTAKPAGARALVMFDYPTSPVTDVLGTNSKSCEDCHGSYGNGFHYGFPAYGGKTCVVCHDATNTTYPRLPALIHGIHKSGDMPVKDPATGLGQYTASNGDKFSIKFPSYMQNCSICHTSGAPLTAANSKPVTYDLCMTCHQNWNGYGTGSALSFHTGMTTATNCATCHDGATAPATMGAIHNKYVDHTYTANGGLVYNGIDLSVTNGAKADVQITGVTRTGSKLDITWTAKYDGATIDPCNATPSTTVPSFAHTAVSLVDHGVAQAMAHNFAFLLGFFQGDDIVNADNGVTSPGQPSSINVVFTNQTGTPNTSCTANVAKTTITLNAKQLALADKAGAKGRVGLQGKPVMSHDAKAAGGTGYNYYLRAKSPVYDFKLDTGAVAPIRRSITESDKCLKCHVGSLYQHGGNRVDSVELCVMCHNEASSEQNVRVSMGITSKDKTYDGKIGQTYGFKSMLHAVHASGNATFGQNPLAIYRTRGIYGFALSEAMLYNWPGATADKVLVYGADPALAASKQPHNFVTAHYPRPLQDCFACHASNFSRIADPTKAVATTFDAGAAPWDNQLDDKLQGATAAACTSCHSGSATAAHANQFGWTPALVGGRQAVIDAAK